MRVVKRESKMLMKNVITVISVAVGDEMSCRGGGGSCGRVKEEMAVGRIERV